MNGRKFNQAVVREEWWEKKTGNHIRTHMNFGRTLTRYSLRIFVFHFSFFSFFYRNSQWKCSSVFLENSVKYYVFLGPNIDRRENTLIASSRISTSFLIIFSVIFFNVIINNSIWEAKTKFVYLLRNKFSSNTHYIFKNKLRKHITNISKHHLPEWQINSTIYADVAF